MEADRVKSTSDHIPYIAMGALLGEEAAIQHFDDTKFLLEEFARIRQPDTDYLKHKTTLKVSPATYCHRKPNGTPLTRIQLPDSSR